VVEHQTEQELHAYLLENFNQIFPCQIVGHEVKLKEGIVDFVGEASHTREKSTLDTCPRFQYNR
jgi:hypothetical protein